MSVLTVVAGPQVMEGPAASGNGANPIAHAGTAASSKRRVALDRNTPRLARVFLRKLPKVGRTSSIILDFMQGNYRVAGFAGKMNADV